MTELEKKAQKAIDIIDGETEMGEIFYRNTEEMGEPVEVGEFCRNYISTGDMEEAYSASTLACEKTGFYYGFRAAVKLMKSLDLFDEEESE